MPGAHCGGNRDATANVDDSAICISIIPSTRASADPHSTDNRRVDARATERVKWALACAGESCDQPDRMRAEKTAGRARAITARQIFWEFLEGKLGLKRIGKPDSVMAS